MNALKQEKKIAHIYMLQILHTIPAHSAHIPAHHSL